jgi:phosphoribosylformylglycinamidine synthase subunit PurS
MKAKVFVTLKPSVFDPQGHTIVDALQSLGYSSVADVRQGKYFELELNVPTPSDAEKLAAEVADRVLSNPVIESFRIEVGSAPVVSRVKPPVVSGVEPPAVSGVEPPVVSGVEP